MLISNHDSYFNSCIEWDSVHNWEPGFGTFPLLEPCRYGHSLDIGKATQYGFPLAEYVITLKCYLLLVLATAPNCVKRYDSGSNCRAIRSRSSLLYAANRSEFEEHSAYAY